MKIIIAPDSFKGSLTAVQVADQVAKAALRHFPDAELVLLPVADGGEGTLDALRMAAGGVRHISTAYDPLGRLVECYYLELPSGETVIEMAQASGLPLLQPEERNPLKTSSFGTGQLMRRALDEGAHSLILGIGGSATNDGGMGMLSALGAVFTDSDGRMLTGCGAQLAKVANIDLSGLDKRLKNITVMCDVQNPLLGDQGATRIYGAQKGADAAMQDVLEEGMAHYAEVLFQKLGKDIASFPGAGAAGGLGAVLGGVLGAKIRRGIDFVLDLTGFDRHLQNADLVITGEGHLDAQTVRYGKVAAGIVKRCAPQNIPVCVLCGGMDNAAMALFDRAPGAVMTTVNGIMPLSSALQNAGELLDVAADNLFRMIDIGYRLHKP